MEPILAYIVRNKKRAQCIYHLKIWGKTLRYYSNFELQNINWTCRLHLTKYVCPKDTIASCCAIELLIHNINVI